jgi:hypothetical protein
MNKLLLVPMGFVLFSLLSGCTTERRSPPPTVIYQESPSAANPHSDTREAAREGAREGVRDPYR